MAGLIGAGRYRFIDSQPSTNSTRQCISGSPLIFFLPGPGCVFEMSSKLRNNSPL